MIRTGPPNAGCAQGGSIPWLPCPHARPSRSRMTVPVPYVLALADDLSGAAETACALGGPVRLSLAADVAGSPATHDLVVDLDTRHL